MGSYRPDDGAKFLASFHQFSCLKKALFDTSITDHKKKALKSIADAHTKKKERIQKKYAS